MLKFCKILLYVHIISLHQIKSINCDKNYCSPNFCNNSKEHVMCKLQLKGPARHCYNYERMIKSAADQQVVLDKINSRRNKVAAGEIRSLRAAENMAMLEWNEELATFAQRWADQCVAHSVPDTRDICRDLGNISVGQNIASIYDDAPGLTSSMLVDLWYIELLNVNSSMMSNYQRTSMTGSDHYEYFTQLVWADTTQVGCGAVKFKEEIETMEGFKNRTVYRLVCNFATAGNIEGRPAYSDGLPCSRCPFNGTCDSVYKALCSPRNISIMKPNYHHNPINQQASMGSVPHIRPKYFTTTESSNTNFHNDPKKITDLLTWPENISDYDENMSFDFFTDLFEVTTKTAISITENITVCKEVLIVDELFHLLKRKLSNDQSLRELLLITKSSSSENTEELFTDPSVADILSHIYTTKETMTTTKTTNEYLNSTLLVDLVEAVIFRNNDKFPTSAVVDLNNESVTEVNPVKIKAELGETRFNSDFTGHYFFPEDNNDETNRDKQTDNYYDMTDLSISDVAFEIEELRRNKGTKDFLEEILDSDFVTEAITQMYINNNDDQKNEEFRGDSTKTHKLERRKRLQLVRKRRNEDVSPISNNKSMETIRKRRRLIGTFINYSDLLKQLAEDLKWLQLTNIIHCSQHNSDRKTAYTSILVFVTLFLNKLII